MGRTQDGPIGRVAVVGRFPPPLDGQTILTRGLADMLDPDPGDQQRTPDGVRHLPNAVLRINTEPSGSSVAEIAPRSPARMVHFTKLRFQMERELSRFRPDQILWPAVSPGTAGHFRDRLMSLPAFPGNARIFAVIHRGNFHEVFTRRTTRFSSRRMIHRVDGFVFNSEGLAMRCVPWIPSKKRFVIPNTIESDMLFDSRELDEKRVASQRRDGLQVLYLSNMITSKGYFDVAKAMALLDDPRIQADFVGAWMSESDRAELMTFIQNRGLENRIRVHGAVSDRVRIREFLLASDVLVLPTYYPNEAQPLVVVEALSASVPVIATPHCSLPEMIEEDVSGLFVSPLAPSEIADALLKLRDTGRWTRLSKGARRRFEEQFAPDVVRRKWLQLLGDTWHSRV